MKISIDLDGVLCDFESAARRIGFKLFGRELGRMPSQRYLGALPDEWKQIWDQIIATPNFYVSLDPIAPNVSKLRYWMLRQHTRQHSIVFLTSRAQTAGASVSEQSWRWLGANGLLSGMVSQIELVAVPRARDKRDRIIELAIDASIDDFHDTVKQCHSDSHTAFLMDTGRGHDGIPVERVVPDLGTFLRAIGVDQ